MTLTELLIGAAYIAGAVVASSTPGILALTLIEIITNEWEAIRH